VPAGPINTVDKVLEHRQVKARNMVIETTYNDGKKLRIAGNPIKMSTFADDLEAPPLPRSASIPKRSCHRFWHERRSDRSAAARQGDLTSVAMTLIRPQEPTKRTTKCFGDNECCGGRRIPSLH